MHPEWFNLKGLSTNQSSKKTLDIEWALNNTYQHYISYLCRTNWLINILKLAPFDFRFNVR